MSVSHGIGRHWIVRHWRLLLAAAMLTHLAFLCLVKLSLGSAEQIGWFCHLSLGVAAVGVITRSPLLISVTLTNIFVVHTLWIIDFVYGNVTGQYPVTLSAYTATADTTTWLVAMHHLFLLPVMLGVFLRDRTYPRITWLITATAFTWVTLIAGVLTSPEHNVNYVYYIPDSLSWSGLCILNELPEALYLLGLNIAANVVAFFPASLLLYGLSKPVEPQLDDATGATTATLDRTGQTAACL